MNAILRYCLAGIKIFIACVIAFVAVREAASDCTALQMAVCVVTALISAAYLTLGVGQLFGFFLTTAASRAVRASEWFLLAFLAARLCMML